MLPHLQDSVLESAPLKRFAIKRFERETLHGARIDRTRLQMGSLRACGEVEVTPGGGACVGDSRAGRHNSQSGKRCWVS